MDFYISSKSLKRIKEAGIEDNFKIIVFDSIIHCSTFVSAFISPKITKILKTDPTVNKFTMKFDSKSEFYSSIDELKKMIKNTDFITRFTNFLQGEPFHFDTNTDSDNQVESISKLNAETAKLLIEFGKILDNEDMIEEGIKELLFRQDGKEMTMDKAINTIKINQKYRVNGDIGKIPYDFFSSHFYLLYNRKAREENKTYHRRVEKNEQR